MARHAVGMEHIVETRYFEVGLHDRPDGLRNELQSAIASFDAREDIDAVVLLYALCGLGTAGLVAGKHPVVIARAHDCITLFMGSKEAFARQQAECPDSFYYTPGWMKAARTPGPARLESLRAEFSEKFDPEDVDFLLESERANWAQHSRAVFLDLDTQGADDRAAEAQEAARELGWTFERIPGDASLFLDLLSGNWDEDRFQIVPPGHELTHCADSSIFRARQPPQHEQGK